MYRAVATDTPPAQYGFSEETWESGGCHPHLARSFIFNMGIYMAIDLKLQSPLGIYLEHCAKGELAYQVCTDTGALRRYS